MLGKTSWYSIDISGNDRHILLFYKKFHFCHLLPFAKVGQFFPNSITFGFCLSISSYQPKFLNVIFHSLTFRIAIKSSEMLYIYAHLDPRVCPLVFMVRYWAKLNGITNNNPGYWITNYPLTLLVIFFLQTRPHPVVPALDKIALFGEFHQLWQFISWNPEGR